MMEALQLDRQAETALAMEGRSLFVTGKAGTTKKIPQHGRTREMFGRTKTK